MTFNLNRKFETRSVRCMTSKQTSETHVISHVFQNSERTERNGTRETKINCDVSQPNVFIVKLFQNITQIPLSQVGVI